MLGQKPVTEQGGLPRRDTQFGVVSIDQYAEAAAGNRNYFLNKPYVWRGNNGVP